MLRRPHILLLARVSDRVAFFLHSCVLSSKFGRPPLGDGILELHQRAIVPSVFLTELKVSLPLEFVCNSNDEVA